MAQDVQERLFLRVKNPQELGHGSLPSFSLDKDRATIGSGGVDWRLYDPMGTVEALHAEVGRMDGQFTLVDLCGKTYINEHQDALGKMHIVALRDLDLIRIGKYEITVNIGDGAIAAVYNVNHLRELEVGQLFNIESGRDWLDAMPSISAEGRGAGQPDEYGVLQQLLEYREACDGNDFIHDASALEAKQAQQQQHELETVFATRFAAQSQNTIVNSAPELVDSSRRFTSPSNEHLGVEAMADHAQKTDQQPLHQTQEVDHIVSGPLINSLGAPMEEMDTEQAHHFLHQSGRALQAAIQGLLALYQMDKENKVDLALLGRSYQAIEDNPLRMDMSYEETVKALFSPHKSRVHLAPEHAIEESMQNIRDSQLALISSIQESLRQLLQAFDPENLQQRFDHYRREQDAETADDAWSWRMYQDYYTEMASSRQTGLEKMFWEIFEQTYDRKMRAAEKV